MTEHVLVAGLLDRHFGSTPLEELVVTERLFPYHMRADVQRAVRAEMERRGGVSHLSGVQQRYDHLGLSIPSLLVPNQHDPQVVAPLQFEDLDGGEDEPMRCLAHALWLAEADGGLRYVVLMASAEKHGCTTGLRVQVAVPAGDAGVALARDLMRAVEAQAGASPCYRGKILSLEKHDHFSGLAQGVSVHRIAPITRAEVILPEKTVDLLDRNVLDFCALRGRLRELGLPTKKGLLFYGPPGTGKTHTVRYLTGALDGHTTLLMSGEQVGLIDDYMTLARLLAPSIVVIEDVDLIARDRETMNGACSEVLLNKLLNEMDGLRPDADILFVLTTNRPQALEAALASRPGRIDQAIEFPLPDADGRTKLIRLYSCGLQLSDAFIETAARRTEGVSASFIKELMRRVAQYLLGRSNDSVPTVADLDLALDELLFAGGSLNRALLGGPTAPEGA